MTTTPQTDFLKVWAERAFDRVQIAQIEAIETAMVDYARNGWRKVYNGVEPPRDVMLLTAGLHEGIQLLRLQPNGEDWRTSTGQPSKPPSHWMPAPNPPE